MVDETKRKMMKMKSLRVPYMRFVGEAATVSQGWITHFVSLLRSDTNRLTGRVLIYHSCIPSTIHDGHRLTRINLFLGLFVPRLLLRRPANMFVVHHILFLLYWYVPMSRRSFYILEQGLDIRVILWSGELYIIVMLW